jgi:long-chain acyl-CoA synthetase
MAVELKLGVEDSRVGIGGMTVCEAFQRAIRRHADRVALRTRGGATEITWGEYGGHVERLAGGLAGLGLGRGATIGLQLSNRPEFHLIDMAALHLGAVPFAIYNTSPVSEIVHRIENADAEILVTERAYLGTIRQAAVAHGGVRHIILVDGQAPGVLGLDDVVAAAPDEFDFATSWQRVGLDDLCAITYTSGTTGPPKGAQWSHRGVAATLDALGKIVTEPVDLVSYLPMAHAGERMFGHYMPLIDGGTITSCPNPREVLDYIREVRPNVMMMPPRVWDKVIAGIRAGAERFDAELRARLDRCLEIGTVRARAESAGESVDPALIAEHDALAGPLRASLLAPFGLDRVAIAVIGAAPSQPETLLFYHAIGLPLLEAYGLTECGTLAVINRPDDYRVGTVGKPISGLQVRIAEDGEVLLRSEMNMVGYRKQPEETARTIDADGWLHTGDIGELDTDGFLRLVDRKKDLIISATGKTMSPANIEAEIRSASDLIGQAVAIGDGRPYNVAVITLDADAAPMLARRLGARANELARLAKDPVILQELERAVAAANARLSRPEQIKYFAVLPVAWSPDSDELTPTMKLKRRAVVKKYQSTIDELYAR